MTTPEPIPLVRNLSGFDPTVFADKWTPFIRVHPVVPAQVTEQERAEIERTEYFQNSRYYVARRSTGETPECGKTWWLSIRENDRGVRHIWRDFQRIKNELCGAECEGIELYPPDRFLVDSANQYHLWVFEHSLLIEQCGVGFRTRFVMEPADLHRQLGAMQAPFTE